MPSPPRRLHTISDTLPVGWHDLDPLAIFEVPSAREIRVRFAWRAFDDETALVGWGTALGCAVTPSQPSGDVHLDQVADVVRDAMASFFDRMAAGAARRSAPTAADRAEARDDPIADVARFVRRTTPRCRDAEGRPTTARPRWFVGFAFHPLRHHNATWIDAGLLSANAALPEVQLAIRRRSTRLTVCHFGASEMDARARWAAIRDEVLALARSNRPSAGRRRDARRAVRVAAPAPSVQSTFSGAGSMASAPAGAAPSDDLALGHRLHAALAAIQAGRVAKVVVATSVTVPLAPAEDDVPAIARAVAAGAPGCTTFLYEAPQEMLSWLGATPERLVRVRGRRLWTMALAGTAPRGRTAAEDRDVGAALLASAKDRREHAAVVDGIRAALADVPGLTVDVAPSPRLRRLATMQHLETPITGRATDRLDVLALAHRLHPTPALAGSPRDAALELIAELEPDGRGWYGGAVGWVDGTGDGDLAVGIRGVLVAPGQATAYAGAGIVAGSDPAAEAREIALKLDAALRPLRVFAPQEAG